jgi:putative iron-dependent peroxidase
MIADDARLTTHQPQPGIAAAEARNAIFLVLGLTPGGGQVARTRRVLGGLNALVRAIAARDVEGNLSCVAAFGSDAWERLFGQPRPSDLHPFRALRAGTRVAPATPGDILLHIRAERTDLCFELAAQIVAHLGDSVTALDETHGSAISTTAI